MSTKNSTNQNMAKIKVYYFKNEKDMPFDVQQDIVVFGQPKMAFISQYYTCVYEIDEKRKIKDINTYLRYLVQKFTFKDGPLTTDEKSKWLEEIGCHSGIAMGDIIQINNDFYAVEYGKCVKIIN